MSGIRIYLEGGGQSKETRAPLRAGMEQFLGELRDRARARRWSFQVIACGGREETRAAFANALEQHADALNLLLVDSEEPVKHSPLIHLRRHWPLPGVAEEQVHLMAQTMEAWIAADPAALANFYGKEFQANSLPRAVNLETVPKADLERALAEATRRTQKGSYHKTAHAGRLLGLIDPRFSKTRCPHCERLFSEVTALLTQ